jgi:hypothetical protein
MTGRLTSMPIVHPLGPDPYSDDHPRGKLNQAMREKSRQAHQLYDTQPLGTPAAPGPASVASVPVTEADLGQLADALAEAIARRETEPTQAEVTRDKSRQLLRLMRERDAAHLQRATAAVAAANAAASADAEAAARAGADLIARAAQNGE